MAASEQEVANAGSDATTSLGAGGSEVGASGITEELPAGKQQKCAHESSRTAIFLSESLYLHSKTE